MGCDRGTAHQGPTPTMCPSASASAPPGRPSVVHTAYDVFARSSSGRRRRRSIIARTALSFVPILLTFISSVSCDWPGDAAAKASCAYPSVPLYAEMQLSPETAPVNGSLATYKCNDGYELFGTPTRTCVGGKWMGALPYCAVNVAYGKPTNQSSTVKGGESRNANDGELTTMHDNRYCTETRVENSPWWQVDLLQPYEIRVIRILTRSCCGLDPLHDLEIRVGNSSNVQGNRLCAWYPGTLNDEEKKDFHCANAIVGRYVHIQMVGLEGALSLCEVFVFTTKEFSSNRCGHQMEYQQITSFNQTCYEFQTTRGGSFGDADGYCKSRGGLLINSITEVAQNFLYYELERYKPKLRSKLIWVGARRDFHAQNHTQNLFGTRPRLFWHWINGTPINKFLWAEDQPNNYNGQQNCIVLDGGRRWLWNDVTCDLDYLPWICQYAPSNCGSPDVNENATIVKSDYRISSTVAYSCAEGCRLDGLERRTCLGNGFWEGRAPKCTYVECGALGSIEHGRVSYTRTNFNATAAYSCSRDYALVGDEHRRCLGNGTWSGREPRCYYSHCSGALDIDNGMVAVTNRSINGTATFTCKFGFVLVGNAQQTCQLGGSWSGHAPQCKFIDCRLPLEVYNGFSKLVNKTTYYNSLVQYDCEPNYILVGNRTRTCTEFGTWSGAEPTCELINCGIPKKAIGVRYAGETFTINSQLIFDCEPGYKLLDGGGSRKRVCQSNGKWSGTDIVCKFIECGRVQPILKGEITYVNQTTYLGSEISYSCGTGYRLVGNKVRTCLDDGRWSGAKPKCEEIRCAPPEIPKNSSVVYNGNDRSFSDSFKVGSTVQYRCSLGHIVAGQSLRTCETSGHWSEAPPICFYIDCGLPFPVSNGRWLLTSNTTYYGSTVEYECNLNYKLMGPARRICQDNGTWSNIPPTCEIVTCVDPEKKDDKTVVDVNSYFVGGKATYTCSAGLELIGVGERFCQTNGHWSGQIPYCRFVDCGRPPIIPNGRGYLVNGTTFFGSVVEYHCLPEFKMISDSPQRVCLPNGQWSGTIPRCLEVAEANEIENSLRNSASEHDYDTAAADSSKSIGVGVSFSIGTILILIIIIGFLFLKVKKQQQQSVKSTENIEVSHQQPNKDMGGSSSSNGGGGGGGNTNGRVLTYSRMCLETDFNCMPPAGGIRQTSNLVTFSSPNNGLNAQQQQQPLYANLPVAGAQHNNEANVINVPVNANLTPAGHRFASARAQQQLPPLPPFLPNGNKRPTQ